MSPKRARKKAATAAPKRSAAAKRGPAAKRRPAVKRKPAAKRAVAKRAPARRKAAAKRATPGRKTARRPALRLVKRPAPKPARPAKPRVPRRATPPPFAGALATASAKDLAMFDLVRARVEVQAAIQGLVAASAEIPVGEGQWTPRQIVLHLHYWDREMLPWIEKAARHDLRPPHTKDDILAENQSSQLELGALDWDQARRLMQQSREALIESLQSLPEEPDQMWSGEHSLGWLIRILANHDRHHAARIKNARAGVSGGA